MKYFVYILYSETLQKYYTGSCSDLKKRLDEHHSGKSRFTSTGMPWIQIFQLEVESRSEAVKLEMKVKKRGAKRFINDQLNG
jgi:putative endonuclease